MRNLQGLRFVFILVLMSVVDAVSAAPAAPTKPPDESAPAGAGKNAGPGDSVVADPVKGAFKLMFPTIKVERSERFKNDSHLEISRFFYREGYSNFRIVFKETRWIKTYKSIAVSDLSPAVAKVIARNYSNRKLQSVAVKVTPARGPVYEIVFADLEVVLDFDGTKLFEESVGNAKGASE